MAIAIEIIEIAFRDADEILGTSDLWLCWLKVTDDAIPQSYMLPANAPGNLAKNELQAHFDGQSAGLWTLASAKQYPTDSGATGAIEAKGGARQWYTSNPAAQQLFTMTSTELETTISSLIDITFPLLTVGQRRQWRLFLTSLAYNDRIAMRRLGPTE